VLSGAEILISVGVAVDRYPPDMAKAHDADARRKAASAEGRGAHRGETQVKVIRSAKRHKTVSARREGGILVVSIPAAFTAAQEREWVARMSERVLAKEAKSGLDDAALARRARTLSERYLGGAARPLAVTWSTAQLKRWGSATKERGTIRLSALLAEVPAWVLDYVLLHELIHLITPHGHGPRFQAALSRYPHAAKAEGFLHGLAWARAKPLVTGQSADDVAWPPPGEETPAPIPEDAPCPLTLF
jgi:predicted metal-dependent hydrolase